MITADENIRTEELAFAIVQPLPDELHAFAELAPHADHPWLGRIQALIQRLSPVMTYGLTAGEVSAIEQMLRARMMLICTHLPCGGAADAALDSWLAATVTYSVSWSEAQRRVWWNIESLSLTADILDAWTRSHSLATSTSGASPTQVEALARAWLALARRLYQWDDSIVQLFALQVSEGLLACLHAYRATRALSLRACARAVERE